MSKKPLFLVFPQLETKRLMLREMSILDAGDLLSFLGDAETLRYYDMAPYMHTQDVLLMIERHHARFVRNEGIRWAIALKGEDRVIGSCGFLCNWHSSVAEISYILAQPYWNKGIMTEVLRALLSFGFERYQLSRIDAHVFEQNRASLRVLQKVGFREESRIPANGVRAEELLCSFFACDYRQSTAVWRTRNGDGVPTQEQP